MSCNKKNLKKLVTVALTFLLIVSLWPSAALAQEISGTCIYGDATYDRCFYERMVVLPNGDLLATWQREFPLVTNWSGMESFLFYKSSDQGKTWTQVSELNPSNYTGLTKDKMGMPGLYVLPQQVGSFPAGTILFATSDWKNDSEYCIHIWRSQDNGVTWTLHSNLASRGDNDTTVWEPEFTIDSNNNLVCFFSDERQEGYDQCIAYETSSDGGLTWGNYTIVAGEYREGWRRGIDPSLWRPGMPRVLKLKDGSYFMAYENISASNNGIITCRVSSDGINWGSTQVLGTPVSFAGSSAYQCPMVAYIDDGSTYGVIILRGMNDTCSEQQCFMSADKGQTWEIIDAPLTAKRNENVASGWSGTFVTVDNKVIELNNYYNGTYNEIRCGNGLLCGKELFVDGAVYQIKNAASGLCIDDAGGSMDWGNEMILWNTNDLGTQEWKFVSSPNAFTMVCQYSDLALDNPNGSLNVGTRIVQWDKNYSTAQQWLPVDAGDGTFRIQNVRSGLYLDTENGSTQTHAKIIQNSQTNNATQKWSIERKFDSVRIKSYNINDCHIYHDSDSRILIANASTSMPESSSEWKIVPGLADASCVSIQSVDNPSYYLRHYEGNAIISQNDGSDIFKQDATWRVVPGLANPNGVSFASYNITGTYLRHYNSYLRISPMESEIDRQDATFVIMGQ